MKHILIPTDFSENSWNALEYTVMLFRNEACIFYILHIATLKESSVQSNSFTFASETIHPSIKEKLDALFGRIQKLPAGQRNHFVALKEYGNFLTIIRKTVEVKNIDLIALGTKGASGLKAAVIGSNSGDVITKVVCNVLVIPEKARIIVPKKIAFATDYSLYYSHSILEALTDILRISKAHLQVFNVTQNNIRLTHTQEKNKAYLQDYIEEILPFSNSFHSISNINIKTAILHFSANNFVEMVVMVAKNLNFLQQLFFDTTIEKLSFHITVPLLVLHE